MILGDLCKKVVRPPKELQPTHRLRTAGLNLLPSITSEEIVPQAYLQLDRKGHFLM